MPWRKGDAQENMASLVASEAQVQWYWTSAKETEAEGDEHGYMGTLK